MKMNLDKTKPRYSEHILRVPWPFVISRFHCITQRQPTSLNTTTDFPFSIKDNHHVSAPHCFRNGIEHIKQGWQIVHLERKLSVNK